VKHPQITAILWGTSWLGCSLRATMSAWRWRGRVATIYDPRFGPGAMLTITKDFIQGIQQV